MKLFELTTKYQSELNPKLWDGEKLRPEVREKLLNVAEHFQKFLKVKTLKLDDVVMTGSLANYNWTEQSDIDVHLIADVEATGVNCVEVTSQLFDAKKDIWAEKYDVTIKGFPIEVYVQDSREPHPVAMAVYSLVTDKWIDKPKYDPPKIDKKEIVSQAKDFAKEIDKVFDTSEIKKAKALKDEIKKVREKGLHSDGEFSTGNLAFKELRNNGMLGKLMDFIKDKETQKLSLEGVKSKTLNTDFEHTPSEARISQRLQAMWHEAEQYYNQIIKLTDPFLAANVVPNQSNAVKNPEEGCIIIPMYYQGDPFSPQSIRVRINKLPPKEAAIAERIGKKMTALYKEQTRYGNMVNFPLTDHDGWEK